MTGRILALDAGERRIGVALSDPTGTIASPLTVIDRAVDDEVSRLQSICEEYEVHSIVVGLPIGLSGGEGPAAAAARDVAQMAAAATGLPVDLHDERFTTSTAEAALIAGGMRRDARRGVRDKVAAAVLLQGYLDAERKRGDADPGTGSGADGA